MWNCFADALLGCRGHREKGSQERILTSFLTEMDGVGVRLDSGVPQVTTKSCFSTICLALDVG